MKIEKASNVVRLRFTTFTEAKDHEVLILKTFREQCENAFEVYNEARKLPSDEDGRSEPPLPSSVISMELSDAIKELHSLKADVDAMHAENDRRRTLLDSLNAALESRNEALHGHSAIAKRSHRFASANPARFYGPTV